MSRSFLLLDEVEAAFDDEANEEAEDALAQASDEDFSDAQESDLMQLLDQESDQADGECAGPVGRK